MDDEKIIIISGPSGVGKTTIYKKILSQLQEICTFSISATTRPCREGEVDGEDYYFLSYNEFQNKIEQNEFIEWNQVHKYLYGTLKSEVYRIWEHKKIPLLDIDVHGGMNIKQIFNDKAHLIFIAPPSMQDLEMRLRGRATNDENSIKVRLVNALEEMKYKDFYQDIVVNQDVDIVVKQLVDIINKIYIKKSSY